MMDLDDDSNTFQFNELHRSNGGHARFSDEPTATGGESERKRADNNNNNAGGSIDLSRRFYSWPSSRIVRVPRASGGKDRHSKVVTSKGQLRDRRVRLSVNTAIQFYDLQDRLGYDQPSKAVEWLLKAAETSISGLPPVVAAANGTFPDTPEKRPSISTTGGNNNNGGYASDQQLTLEDLDTPPPPSVAAGEVGGCNNSYLPQEQRQQQGAAGNKSCSSASTTETTSNKGSGLSLSRSEIRVKARERAKERVAEKEKDTTTTTTTVSQPTMDGCSFTELLSSGMNNKYDSNSPNSQANFSLKSPGNWSSITTAATTTTPMADYFTNMLKMQLASNNDDPTAMASPRMFISSVDGDNHNGDHFSFHAVNSCNNNNNSNGQQNGTLNFFTMSSSSSTRRSSISSSSLVAGFNGGTLQSNYNSYSSSSSSMLWPSSLHELPRRFPNTIDGSPHHQSFFVAAAHHPMENGNSSNNVDHYQFLSGYNAPRLQLCYGNPNRSQEKGKN